VAQLVGVVDGSDSGLGGVESARLASGVHGDVFAEAGGLFDGGGEFGLGVLVDGVEFSIANGVGAGFINLDEVGAFLELLADGGDEFVGVVGVGGVGQDVLLGVVVERVLVPAENVDGVAADAKARAGVE